MKIISSQIFEPLKKNTLPEGCIEEFKDKVCMSCIECSHVMVGHPGGASFHQVEKYSCDLGYWKDDF